MLRSSSVRSGVLSGILFASGLILFSQCSASPDGNGSGGEGGSGEGEGGSGEGEGGSGEGGTGEGGSGEGEGGSGEGGTGEGGSGEGGTGEGGTQSQGGTGGTQSQGGTGGTQSQGGTGGTATSSGPCPDAGNCRILTIGDGIAQGLPGTQGGYRARLFTVLTDEGYRFEFVGSKSSGSRPETRPHEGTPDDRSDQLAAKLPGLINSTNPHIVILNIGAEDVEQNYMLTGFRTRLAGILTSIRTARPNALIVVSHPNPTTNSTFNTRLATLETALAAEVDARRNAGDTRLSRVPLRRSFENAFSSGSVNSSYLSGTKYYPSAAGYTILGNAYVGQFQRYLKK